MMALARFDGMLIGIGDCTIQNLSNIIQCIYYIFLLMIIGLDDLKFKMIERSKSSFNKLLSVIRRYGYPYSLVNESMRSL